MDNALNMLENKQLDFIANVLKSEERQERFLFLNIPYRVLTPAMCFKNWEKEYVIHLKN